MSLSLGCAVVFLTWTATYCSGARGPSPETLPPLVDKVEAGDVYPEFQDFGLPCGAFVKRSNGGNFDWTLSAYLESLDPLFVQCRASVNDELKAIFRNTEESAEIRNEVRGTLGDVCAMYVDMFSIVARMTKQGAMCDADALVDDTIKDRDFCQIVPDDPKYESMATTLLSLGYSNYSKVLTNLLYFGSDCPSKCGEGNGRILCNAYFSMVPVLIDVLLRDLFPLLANTKADTALPVHAEVQTTHAHADPLPIDKLLAPISSLSKQELQYLATIDSVKYRRSILIPLLKNFSSEELEAFLARPDLDTIMRMFWVARLVYKDFSLRTLRELEFGTRDTNLFHEGSLDSTDENLVKNFDDSAMVLKYIYNNRELLFSKMFATVRHDLKPVENSATISILPSKNMGDFPNDFFLVGEVGEVDDISDEEEIDFNQENVNRARPYWDTHTSQLPWNEATERKHPMNRARPYWNTHTSQPPWNEATERKHPMNRARPYWNTHTSHRARPYWNTHTSHRARPYWNTHTAQPRWNEANEATEGKPWYWNTYLDDLPRTAATERYWNTHLDGADDAVPKTERDWQAATEGYWSGDSWGSTNQYLDFWNEEDRKGRSTGMKAVFITLVVLSGLFALFLVSVCAVLLACCCVHRWDKVRRQVCCNTPQKVKYYRLSTEEI